MLIKDILFGSQHIKIEFATLMYINVINITSNAYSPIDVAASKLTSTSDEQR